jgi:hypothetical protein
LRIWNECIMLVLDYLMGRRIRHYWLTMNLPKCFGIQNGVVFFFWIIKGTNVVKEQGAMVGPCITIVATVVWIALSKDNSNSLWLYGQIF